MDQTASPASPPRKAPPAPVAIGAGDRGLLLLLILLSPLLRWRKFSSQALREILRAEMTRVSDSVYVLQISPVRLRLFPGSIAFDSAYVTTDTIRKASYPDRPTLRLSAHDCQLSGVNVWKLIRSRGSTATFSAATACASGPRWPPPTTGGIDARQGAARRARLPEVAARIPASRRAAGHQHPGGGVPRHSARPQARSDPTCPAQRVALQKFSAHFDGRRHRSAAAGVRAPPALQPADRARRRGARHRLGRRDRRLQAHGGRISTRAASPCSAFAWSPATPRSSGSAADVPAALGASCRPTASGSPGSTSASCIMHGKVTTDRIVIGGLNATIETDASLPPRPPTGAPPSRRCTRRRPPPPPGCGSRPTPWS